MSLAVQNPVLEGRADSPETVAQSLRLCRSITRCRARNFYYGLKLTPEPKRSALYAVYAFMRACDDLADEAVQRSGGDAGIARIGEFRGHMHKALKGQPVPGEDLSEPTLWPAFRHVMAHYPIDPAHLHAMLDGQCDDIVKHRYESFEALRGYCYKVASTVGLVCIAVWGQSGGDRAKELAIDRGYALQLTNILRDVVEDAHRDRVYLPQDELERFGYHGDEFIEKIGKREADERFDKLMAFQCERAMDFYERSAPLDAMVDPHCRGTSLAIMRIYRGLLEKIARSPRSVLTQRVRLSSWSKAVIAIKSARQARRATQT